MLLRAWPVAALLVACEAAPGLVERPPAADPSGRAVWRGRVLDALTGEPVAGARVELVGTLRSTASRGDGSYVIETVDEFRWLRAGAEGYVATEAPGDTMTELSLWPVVADDALVAARLAARPSRDHDDPDDPDLTPAARLHLLRGPVDELQVPDEPGVLRQALVAPPPATIRLYRRGPEDNSCVGRVDVIPLEEYTRGVVPHEWIPSWEMESLKAGAVAARNYAWNWILRGGKYDCADLDDTTRSQVYRDDRNARGDQAVAETTGQGVARGDEIISSEYSAENGNPTEFGVDEPLCAGRERMGHGRGMCQWGTQRWAQQQGRTYDWMVAHYYPGAGVTTPEEPEPRVELAQRLARPEPQPCADPAGTFNCADFVPDGRSAGLFDVYVGQDVDLSLLVKNAGGGATAGGADSVLLAVELPEGLLAAERVRIETDAPAFDGATFMSHGAQDDDRNPPADAPGGPTLRFQLHGFAPGETRRVTLRLRGAGYSVPTGGPARVRTWIERVADVYEKPAWDQPAVHNDGQVFNGGDLRMLTEFDVFRPEAWTWDGGDEALVEGWRARGGAAPLAVDTGAGALRLEGAGPDPGMESPFTRIDADRLGRLRVPADPAVAGRLYWRAPGAGFEEARSAAIEIGGDPIDLTEVSGWEGAIEQVRIDLEGDGTTRIEEVVFEAGGVAPPRDAAPPVRDAAEPPARDAAVPPARDARPTDEDGAPVAPDDDAAIERPRVMLSVEYQGGCEVAPGGALTALAALLFGALAARRRRSPGRRTWGVVASASCPQILSGYTDPARRR